MTSAAVDRACQPFEDGCHSLLSNEKHWRVIYTATGFGKDLYILLWFWMILWEAGMALHRMIVWNNVIFSPYLKIIKIKITCQCFDIYYLITMATRKTKPKWCPFRPPLFLLRGQSPLWKEAGKISSCSLGTLKTTNQSCLNVQASQPICASPQDRKVYQLHQGKKLFRHACSSLFIQRDR